MVKELSSKTAPFGVKIISILGIVVSILGILAAIIMFIASFFPSNDPNAGLWVIIVPMILIFFLPTLIFSIFLLKLKNWARIVIIVFGFLSIFQSLVMGLPLLIMSFNLFVFLTFIVPVIISLIITLYLLLNKNVKEAFK